MADTTGAKDTYRRRPGDSIFRVPRARPLRISVAKIRQGRAIGASLWTLVYGFAAIIALGTILLVLPAATNPGQATSLVNALFTATSAVCVTGLVVVDTLDHWSLFGQLVIMLLIQVGGLSFMVSTTIFLIVLGRRIGLRERMLIGESIGTPRIGGVVRLARNIVIFSFVAEAIGTALFYLDFSTQYAWHQALWKSIFQAVSAFNNAGFDVFGGFQSLTGFQNHYLVLLTTAFLIILGGISFMAIENTLRSRGIKHSSVDTKIILLITAILLALGTIVVLLAEFNNPQTLGPMPLPAKIVNAFFQSVTSRTAGFNTFSTAAMNTYVLFFTMILMFVGGASGSTAGGIKVNTFGLIVMTIWNTVRGREHPGVFGREFPIQQVFRALTVLGLSMGIISLVVLILSTTEGSRFINILFESVSAFGTVGLTTGITPELSLTGRLVIIITMFIGRLGPLTITMALAKAQRTSMYRYPTEIVRIG